MQLRTSAFLFSFTMTATLVAQSQFRLGPQTDSPIQRHEVLVTGDIDGDYDVDIVHLKSWDATTGRVGVQLNDGSGSFATVSGALTLRDSRVFNLALVDTDGDGDLDVIAGAISSIRARGWLYLFENDGRGRFRDVTSAKMPTVFVGASAICPLDADGDGDIDLFFGSNYQFADVLLRNDGSGSFTDVSASTMPTTRASSWSAESGDIDRDGDQDIVIVGSTLRIYRNAGNGTFQEEGGGAVRQFSRFPRLVDIDGDLDLDLLFSSDEIFVYRNDGRGRFAAVTGTGLPVGTSGLAGFLAADFDVDGDVDVWVSNQTLDQLFVNDGRGQFRVDLNRIGTPGGATARVFAADVDLDADLDVLQIQSGGTSLRMWQRINQHRQHDAATRVDRGAAHVLEFFAAPGYGGSTWTALPNLSLATAQTPLPGVGIIGLNLATMVALPRVVIPASTGRASLSVTVPVDPRLAGVSFATQALMVGSSGEVGLTTTRRTVIR